MPPPNLYQERAEEYSALSSFWTLSLSKGRFGYLSASLKDQLNDQCSLSVAEGSVKWLRMG